MESIFLKHGLSSSVSFNVNLHDSCISRCQFFCLKIISSRFDLYIAWIKKKYVYFFLNKIFKTENKRLYSLEFPCHFFFLLLQDNLAPSNEPMGLSKLPLTPFFNPQFFIMVQYRFTTMLNDINFILWYYNILLSQL